MLVIISNEVENFVVQSWHFVQIQFLVFWRENEKYCHSKFLNEGTRNNNLDRDLARNLSKQIIRYSFFSRKFESTYFGENNVLSDSFERMNNQIFDLVTDDNYNLNLNLIIVSCINVLYLCWK